MSGAALIASKSEAYRGVPDECLIRCESSKDFTFGVLHLLQNESERRRLIRVSRRHVDQFRLVGNEALRSRYNLALAC